MKPLGPVRRHYWLLQDMAQATGVDLSAAVENGTLDLALAYRLVEGSRGWLDVIAGARYVDAAIDLKTTPDYEAVDEMSRQVVDQVSAAALGAVASGVMHAADDIAGELAGITDDLGDAARNSIRDEANTRVGQRVDDIVGRVEAIPPRDPDG